MFCFKEGKNLVVVLVRGRRERYGTATQFKSPYQARPDALRGAIMNFY
jgi:hypothetical protein